MGAIGNTTNSNTSLLKIEDNRIGFADNSKSVSDLKGTLNEYAFGYQLKPISNKNRAGASK